MAKVIAISEFIGSWREVTHIDSFSSTLFLYKNSITGQYEIRQSDDSGNSIGTIISPEFLKDLFETIVKTDDSFSA